MSRFARVAALLLAVCVALPATAAERRIAVGDVAVAMDVPDAWRMTMLPDEGQPVATVRFQDEGKTFVLMVSVIRPGPSGAPEDEAAVRERAAGAWPLVADGAVEPAPDVRTLQGSGVIGAWFTATDKRTSLPEGDYRYLTSVHLAVDGVPATATLLSNGADDGVAPRREDVLAALSTLRRAE